MSQKTKVVAEDVFTLIASGATVEETAYKLSCAKATLYKHFTATIEKARLHLATGLRQKQVELAKNGNPTMLIWLGKQLLGQRDKAETDVNVKHEHYDFAAIPDDKLRELERLVESAAGSVARPKG